MRSTLWLSIVLPLLSAGARGEEWPQFRGPKGQGHSTEHGLPLHWNETENIVWKIPIEGKGWSSPVVEKERIWLTTATEKGRSLRTICIDREKGQVLYNVEVFRHENPPPIHKKNSYASPTPVLENGRVYVHFGTLGTASLSQTGQILWKTELEYNHGNGAGGSPVLFRDLLIVNCDGTDVQYVVALDKHSGEIRWKSHRKGRMAYSTPLMIRTKGKDQLVSVGGDRVVGYEPLSGKEIWWVHFNGFSNVPRPVFGQGLVFICSGYQTSRLYAVQPEGKGDVTKSHVSWSRRRGVPNNPSPLLVDEELYLVSDQGIATCLKAKTGDVLWRARLKGNFSASPVYVEGRIYFLNENGETTVVAAGTQFKKLCTNKVEGRTLASIAISGQSLYLRTEQHLYRIRKR